ncbi:hypothetical protein AX15_003313 [Amanita polypyramis BW_CC]|nr:hypothetical protein AX15_003313 [Amanita polypyramis BW_CC]
MMHDGHAWSISTLIRMANDLVSTTPIIVSDAYAFIDALKHQGNIGIDDRLLLLEKLLHIMATLDAYGDPHLKHISEDIQKFVIGILYNDLPHPQSGFLSAPPNVSSVQALQANRAYPYRPADGSHYNFIAPTLGKVGHPYAKSVPPTRNASEWALPDAAVVFDTLLKRDKFVPHPGGISSLFFAFADLIIHDIFNTSYSDGVSNATSSYLDLSILYGTSDAQVDSIRRNDGTGRLWNDVFADSRLLHMPPATCALLVLLSRNHNYIAQKILSINERGTFSNPPPTDVQLLKKQDDEIFERARLVNCGFYMHIILGDYVGAILGLVRDGFSWRLDPLTFIRDRHTILPRGEGNVVSVEFNLLYTWHATLSLQDTEWTTNMIKEFFGGEDLDTVSPTQFKHSASKLTPKEDVRKWTFGGLERTETGFFKDADLARVLHNAIEWRAAAFKARGVPEALRVIEVMVIERARKWGTCTLNEFRKFMGLKPYSSFEEWNPDEEIAATATALYHDIDNLELYVGLQAEEAKIPGPGAGLCPGYTISRAILSDAVCLTRGDRFYTIDYTPANLTSWGYQDCQYDRKDGSYGGLLTKLLYRTLPNHFPSRSAYAHFPFLEPTWLHDQMINEEKDTVNKYIWGRPPLVAPTMIVKSYEQVKKILFSVPSDSEDRLYDILKSTLTGNSTNASQIQAKRELVEGMKAASQKIFGRNATEFFAKKTRELIDEKSLKFVNSGIKRADIIRDIINTLPTHWISYVNIVKLPITTEGFADVGRYVYVNDDPVNDWHVRSNARTFADAVREENSSSKVEAIHAIAASVPTAPFFSKALAHIVDYYLSPDKQKEREEIVKIITENETESVMIYVKEALRHHPVISGFYRPITQDSVDGVKSTQRFYVSIAEANLDNNTSVSDDAPVIVGFENIG